MTLELQVQGKEETYIIVRLKSKINIYGTLFKMSGVSFVSETEIDEIRQKRQEEWEKVRKEDDPLGKLVASKAGVLAVFLQVKIKVKIIT